MADHEENHGHSRAAWTAVGIILLGCLIGSVAVLIPSLLVGGIAAVVVIAGAVTGRLMSMAGMGSDGHHAQAGGLIDAPDEVGAETQGKS